MATILAKNPKPKPAAKPLPAVPRQPMTPAQQAEALRRAQAQADQRVKLGTELFKAAEKQLNTQSEMLRQVRSEQKHLRESVQEDVAKSLQAYDQWIGRLDEGFTKALQSLEAKVDAMAAEWAETQKRIEDMVTRSEALFAQGRPSADDAVVERTPPQPLKFRPIEAEEPEPAAPKPHPPQQAAPAPDDEKLYSLILEKLRHDAQANEGGPAPTG